MKSKCDFTYDYIGGASLWSAFELDDDDTMNCLLMVNDDLGTDFGDLSAKGLKCQLGSSPRRRRVYI